MASDTPDRMDTPWFRAWHETCYWSYHAAMTLGFSLRLQGLRNMPQAGPALLVANHQSYFDPPLIGLAAQRPLVYLARKTLFKNRVFTALIRSLNAIPIDQEGVSKEGIRTVLEQLEMGKAVVIFPEGARTPDGLMHPLKPGVLLLIKRTLAPHAGAVVLAGAARHDLRLDRPTARREKLCRHAARPGASGPLRQDSRRAAPGRKAAPALTVRRCRAGSARGKPRG
jgi:1-acyl-sn-glycerol-3-phosphate acyltransferase